ncbi:hypothetical protein Tco_0712136, partial [Tanacetum coccineum]
VLLIRCVENQQGGKDRCILDTCPWPSFKVLASFVFIEISRLYTLRLLDAACKKVLNLLKKGLLESLKQRCEECCWTETEKDQIDNLLKERRFDTSAGNPVKEILFKLNLPDHMSILMDSKMEVKLKNFKKDATLKLFKSTKQERYEHVGPEVTSSQDGKVYKMAKRDYAWSMISRCSRSQLRQAREQAQVLMSNDHYIKSQVND